MTTPTPRDLAEADGIIDNIVEHVRQALRDYGIPDDTIANDSEIASSTHEAFHDRIASALAARTEEAAKIAEADSVRECPYGTDKPGDPTWNHTDDDICPVCKVSGHDSGLKCVSVSRNRIASAIRAAGYQEGK